LKKLLPGLSLALVAGAAAVVPTVALAPPAVAAPGDPGVPSHPVVLFTEDFEHGLADGQVTLLGDYVGAQGETYAAEGVWADASQGNGFVLDGTSTNTDIAALGFNNAAGSGQLRVLATGLGSHNGTEPAAANHAVAAYTSTVSPGVNNVEFRTAAPLDLAVENRFLTFSANVAAVACNLAHPLLQFLLDDGTTEIPVNSSPLDPCVGGGGAVRSTTLVADGSVLFTGSELGIVLRNGQAGSNGNDHAFDDIKVLDATPQLDKAFSRATAAPAGVTTLVFTVTNTSELAAKAGWAFTDALPAGMEVAPTPNFATTCANGAVTAGGQAGDTSVALTGDLATGQASCTLSIDVVTPGATVGDTFTNGPANVDPTVGIDPPGTATLTIVPPQPLVDDCATPITFSTDNEAWRVATTTNGSTVMLPPAPSPWDAAGGNPGGALRTDDLDGQWTEFWSPELLANSYTDDYTALLGTTLRFDYRNDTGIGYNLYLGLRGTNGDTVFFNFRPQVLNSQAPNRIRVPLDPALWRTGFNGLGVDMSSPAPTAAEFTAILESVERFIISAEGRNGADTTFLDNFGSSCDDLGDAPASYGTEGGEAAAHGIVGYDAGAGTADLMLGATVDSESDGVPGATADGDDLAGRDDEDAVSGAVLVTAGETPTVQVEVTNDTAEAATLAGWIDLDENGAFDAGERSDVITVPANDGTDTHTLTFPVASALADDSYLRIRLFDGTVADPAPTGAADGGEVEDHLVQARLAALELVKTSALTTDNGTIGQADAGDVITYTFTVTNTGNVPVTGVSIADPLPGLSAISPATVPTLAPTDEVEFTATYTVSQDDVDEGGQIVNAATANGTDPDGDPVASPAGPPTTTTTPIAPADPDVQVVKTAAITKDEVPLGKADDGDVITYTFTATNHGTATAFDVSVEDPLPGLSAVSPASVASLAPGASEVFTATYTVTAADVKALKISNTAAVTSTGPTRGGVTPPAVTSSSNTVNTATGPLGAPSILTSAEKKVALKVGKNGQPKPVALHDSVTVTGLVPGGGTQGTAQLYGPVATPSDAMCTPENLVGTVAFTPIDGTVDTPSVKVSEPGYYTWVVSTAADRRNLAATHACGLPSETTLVHRADYGKVRIETGYAGTDASVQGRKVRPAQVAIKALGMKAKLDTVGLRKGSMVIPGNVAKGGWLGQSALPGDLVGSTVIAGHVSDRKDRPGAFGKLRKAKKGQVVSVRASDGTVQRYRIDRVFTQPRKKGFSGAEVSTTGAHQLTLVTCTGKVSYANGRFHYTKNLVVVATPIG
jgi:uncharacterized repeat protein (TIGR01451 family)